MDNRLELYGFFSFLLFLFFILVVMVWSGLTLKEKTIVHVPDLLIKEQIYSFGLDNSNWKLKGGFILGTGSIEGGNKLEYYFYRKDKDGGYFIQKIDADKVRIYETKETPHWEMWQYKKSIIYNHGAFFVLKPNNKTIITEQYKIYLPVNFKKLRFDVQ